MKCHFGRLSVVAGIFILLAACSSSESSVDDAEKVPSIVSKSFSVSLSHVDVTKVSDNTPILVDTGDIVSDSLTLEKEQ